MNARIVIPVRHPDLGKSRLGPFLTKQERCALNLYFFIHTLEVAVSAAHPWNCFVISSSQRILRLAAAVGVHTLHEIGGGLNISLEQAASQIGGDAPLLSLSTDLPMLSTNDLGAMIAHSAGAEVVIARDRSGVGTNAMLLARPKLIPYCYGADSLRRHAEEARRAGVRYTTICREGLACDVDTPADLMASSLLSAA